MGANEAGDILTKQTIELAIWKPTREWSSISTEML
jgi:hypothetical protein